MAQQERKILSDLQDDLRCPITGDLFEDPIQVTCCGTTFSRQPLIEWLTPNKFRDHPVCPHCQADLAHFDARSATRNTRIASLVDTFKVVGESRVHQNQASSPHQWECSVTNVSRDSSWSELSLSISKAKFSVRPSLFIAVLDASGSMSGKPGAQVSTALRHIIQMASVNEQVKLKILAYQSDCQEIHRVEQYQTGGGTIFRSAFAQLETILRAHICSAQPSDMNLLNNVSTVTICFLTDGQDGSPDLQNLVRDFREMLHTRWGDNPLTVHTVGFGDGCDRKLLEEMRTCGNREGVFQYAAPNDNEDTLCQRLTSIFQYSTEASSVPLTLTVEYETQTSNISEERKEGKERNEGSEQKEQKESSGTSALPTTTTEQILFPVNSQGHGCYRRWVNRPVRSVLISSPLDNNVRVIPNESVHSGTDESRKALPFVEERWVARCIDEMASEVLQFNTTSPGSELVEVQCSLWLKKLEQIRNVNIESLKERVSYLESQIDLCKIGKSVDVSRLSSLRFSSRFATEVKSDSKSNSSSRQQQQQTTFQAIPPPTVPVLDTESYYEPPVKHYNRRNDPMYNRSPLQESIMNLRSDGKLPDGFDDLLDQVEETNSINYKDSNGNTALMLAAYCGHSVIIDCLIKRFPSTLDLEARNNDNETALTLAVKERGFCNSLTFLLKAGCKIPRPKPLQRFAIDNYYSRTAMILAAYGENSLDVTLETSDQCFEFLFQRAKEHKDFTVQYAPKYLEVALSKGMYEISKQLMSEFKAQPTVDLLCKYCIPKKPDDPETERYIKLADLVLTHTPDLVRQVTEPEKESCLFQAARRGSLPHVKFFLERGAILEQENEKGNTPLWVACYQRYPCIIDYLLDCGADINRKNLKGNPPFYGICERGNVKVATQLIQRGAELTIRNANGDTLLLMACRNGQDEIVSLLLQYVDDDEINFKAHIDGFNAIMACAEQDRADCIRVLYEQGRVDLNQKTAIDNKILAGATPLHIAVYYNRLSALRMLLDLHADPNAVDLNGQTPLHYAVIHGNVNAILMLKSKHANSRLLDKFGNIALAYCRDREDIRKALMDPILMVLLKYARSEFADNEKVGKLLDQYTDLWGNRLNVDCQDYEGNTPLLYATLYGNTSAVELFLRSRACPTLANIYGMNSLLWARYLNNKRLVRLFEKPIGEPLPIQLERLAKYRGDPLLFITSPPPKRTVLKATSDITFRMEKYVGLPIDQVQPIEFKSVNSQPVATSRLLLQYVKDNINQVRHMVPLNRHQVAVCTATNGGDSSGSGTNNSSSGGQGNDNVSSGLLSLIFDAQVFTVNRIADGSLQQHSARDIFAVAMYANSGVFFDMINVAIITKNLRHDSSLLYLQSLLQSLDNLQPFVGECFIGSASVDRKLFPLNREFYFQHFQSASTMWKLALENTPNFATSARKGVIFIVKSKTGRLISSLSPYSFDSEVVFIPNSKFRVTNWYHGDVICLGQENIREHTFGVKERDRERSDYQTLMSNQHSLIIEIREI